MATNWGAHLDRERGALIRYYVANPDRARLVTDAVLDTATDIDLKNNGGLAVFGQAYTVDNFPNRTHVVNFKKVLLLNFREYLDGFGFGFKSGITDDEIGKLAGGNRDLATGLTEATKTGFVESVGLTSGVDARETGVERRIYERDMTQKAILSPDDYIKDANRDLKRIDEETLRTFRESFKNYYENYKYSAEDAKKMALADKEEHFRRLMNGHNAIYKADLFKQAKKRITKQV